MESQSPTYVPCDARHETKKSSILSVGVTLVRCLEPCAGEQSLMCPFGNAVGQVLGRMLVHNSILLRLSLASNGIQDAGAKVWKGFGRVDGWMSIGCEHVAACHLFLERALLSSPKAFSCARKPCHKRWSQRLTEIL